MNSSTNNAWLDEGILYVEFHDLSVESILAMEEKCLALVRTNNITLIPIIVLMKDDASAHITASVASFGKIISSVDIVKHASTIAIVGAQEKVRDILIVVSKLFLNNGLVFF